MRLSCVKNRKKRNIGRRAVAVLLQKKIFSVPMSYIAPNYMLTNSIHFVLSGTKLIYFVLRTTDCQQTASKQIRPTRRDNGDNDVRRDRSACSGRWTASKLPSSKSDRRDATPATTTSEETGQPAQDDGLPANCQQANPTGATRRRRQRRPKRLVSLLRTTDCQQTASKQIRPTRRDNDVRRGQSACSGRRTASKLPASKYDRRDATMATMTSEEIGDDGDSYNYDQIYNSYQDYNYNFCADDDDYDDYQHHHDACGRQKGRIVSIYWTKSKFNKSHIPIRST